MESIISLLFEGLTNFVVHQVKALVSDVESPAVRKAAQTAVKVITWKP